jgi:Polyketide cyclase / dehydrase and lipid transport
MGRFSYRVVVETSASPEDLFAVVADAPGWPRWAGPFVRQASWIRHGDPPPGGVGAVRRLGAWPFFSREEIVDFDPPRRLGYEVVGLPVRKYRAEVEFAPNPSGTSIIWHGSFEAVVPGSGPLLRIGLQAVARGFARRLAAVVERHPPP